MGNVAFSVRVEVLEVATGYFWGGGRGLVYDFPTWAGMAMALALFRGGDVHRAFS